MKNRLLLSLLSGALLGVSWVAISGFFPLIFIALVPLLMVENEVLTKRYRASKVYVNAYITFFTFNLIATWWIYHASIEGAIMAVFFNSALMAIPVWLFHLTRRHIGNKEGYFAFVFYWMAFEWGHFRWELSWPWLAYGNVFANAPNIVQWYEYTGVGGGTLWVLLINLVLFKLFNKVILKKEPWQKQKAKIVTLLSLIILPLGASYIVLSSVDNGENNETATIVLSQPNIDPYKKFDNYLSALDQVNKFLDVTVPNMDNDVDLVIAPETAIPFSLPEHNLEYSDEIRLINDFLLKYPKAHFLTGMSSHKVFKESNSNASKPTSDGLGFYENYNSALLINVNNEIDIYHKSELVLGVERLPLSFIMKYVEDVFDLGGTSGTLGVEKEAKVFSFGNIKVSPTICYESIYGDYTGDFSAKGANVIAIMTNDAWWYDTPGYKQLLAYARLRAIENRKWIARSANTGISCFISPKGEITKRTKWEETTSLRGEIPLIEGETFYVKHGDYLGRLSMFIGVLLLLLTIARRFKRETL
jgi:apolipoprotein N-acyltransferase